MADSLLETLLAGVTEVAATLRNIVWPAIEVSAAERSALIEYLVQTWKEENITSSVANTEENARRERNQVLQWWWERSGRSGSVDTNNPQFRSYLKRQYQDTQRNQLKDRAWPTFAQEWGEDRFRVMEYLQREYVANNSVSYASETTYQTLRRAAELILQWWWRSRYGQLEEFDLDSASARFGRYLLRQYQDTCRVNVDDNIVPDPQ